MQHTIPKHFLNCPPHSLEGWADRPAAEMVKTCISTLEAGEGLDLRNLSRWVLPDREMIRLGCSTREYLSIYDSLHLSQMCDLFGDFLLTPEGLIDLSKIADEVQRKESKKEKIKPSLRPLWLFFIALCYALQEGENELSASMPIGLD